MIAITRNERNYLEKKGHRFGKEIFSTHNKHKKYYAVQTPRIMRELEAYNISSTVGTVTR